MILQKLLFPSAQSGAAQEMYFRTEGHLDEAGQTIALKKDCVLSLDTYFNSFSIEKWTKYTTLSNLQLEFELQGRFRVEIICTTLNSGTVSEQIVGEAEFTASERAAFSMDIPLGSAQSGVISGRVKALEDGTFFGGRYLTDVPAESLNPVDIAIDICTFRREAFVARNIALLNESIIENPESPLNGHIEIFISDNGKTLDIPSLESDRIHIFPNRNVGGSGGFTRGMIEILNHREKHDFTHILVMDDDVLIHPDAIERTYRLLQLMKPEYHGKTIAGAMMRLDHQFIQHENGAFWNGRYTESAHTLLDMRRIESVLSNEDESTDRINYNAWWYSCIPIDKVSMDNLPMPLFVRFDDVEYGLRTGSDVLSLNGICLWHEPFEHKYSSSMDYYHMRNSLITNALYRPDINGLKAAKEMYHCMLLQLVRYRYVSVELILRAADDFLKGPDHLIKTDAEALHKELMSKSIKFQPVETLSVPFDQKIYDDSLRKFDAPLDRVLRGEQEINIARPRSPKEQFKRFVRWVTMNGLLLPAKGTYIVHPVMNHTSAFFRKSAVLNYDPIGKKGFVSTRDRKRSFSLLFMAVGMAFKLMSRHAAVSREYRENQQKLVSREAWIKYLDL